MLQLGQFHEALAELLPWLADNMARLAGFPPPGVQPDNVEPQIQELEVIGSLLHVIVRVLHCVLLQWFITEATEKSYNYNCSTSYFSVLFCPSFLPPPPPVFSHFSPLPTFFSPECGVRYLVPHPEHCLPEYCWRGTH